MELKKFNCLVVDDEPIARKILSSYIDKLPFLELAAVHINALAAIDELKTNKHIDILFLDINMPNLSGVQLLKIVHPHQPVIFTTAYPEHAVESYELDAVDYLLKPFSFERFTKAVYRATDRIKNKNENPGAAIENKKNVFFIKSDSKNHPVLLDDILYCEAMKNYTMVMLKGEKKLMPLISLSRLETLLKEAGGHFIQIHRSFIIAKNHIDAIGASNVVIGKFEIPIGVQFKEGFFREIGMKDSS